ncbi:MAG TPA: GNAT family N-acetyltransferase [Solirubrobacteraceae bacterium]|nr:GNAT family N-acetyltransferase [Solirubrobacteraceae bacterium]
MRIRRAESADLPALLAIDAEGFETYRDFAPPGWEPPTFDDIAERSLDERAAWLLAEEDGKPVGHVMFIPAALSSVPVDDPRLAHVMQVFVRRSHWGTGVAAELMRALVEEAARRGYEEMRLFTPEAQGRARRFYEREGWRLVARIEDTPLGFPVVEYRRPCRIPS